MSIPMIVYVPLKRRFLIATLIFTLALFTTCSKSFLDEDYYKKEIFSEEYWGLYGTWQLIEYGSSSGNYQADFDKLLIYPYGNFHKIRNDTIVQKGIIGIIEQDPTKLKIDFIPLYAVPTSSKWVNFHGTDTLRLTDSCLDCNYHVLKREE